MVATIVSKKQHVRRSPAFDAKRCFLHVWLAGETFYCEWVAACRNRIHQGTGHSCLAKLGQDL